MKIIGNKHALHTPEFHRKKMIEKRLKVAFISFTIMIIVSLPIWILNNKKLLIKNIEIKGNIVTPSQELEELVNEKLNGKYFWLIPHSSFIFYPKSKIQKDLMDKEPRLSAVEVTLINPEKILINVKERKPAALYCEEISDTSNPSGCYLMDDSGFIFSEAPAFSGGVYIVYSSEPFIDNPLRANFLEPKIFNDLESFINSLSEAGLYPKVFVSKSEEYHIILSNGADIMWKSNQNLESIRSNLISFVEDSNFQKDKNNLNNVLYIDLRFGNKIFYKYR